MKNDFKRKNSKLWKLINFNKKSGDNSSNTSDNEIKELSKNDNDKEDYSQLGGNAYYFARTEAEKERVVNDEYKKVLILYTGGTIGMEKSESGLKPRIDFLLEYMFNHSNFCDKKFTINNSKENDFNLNADWLITPQTLYGKRIYYKIYEFDYIIDSSNMNLDYWKKIGRCIKTFYDNYDSFIVLHGTDTMNYTASILSFMLENLNKLVILTGSQIPLIEMRNDAQKNLIDALTIAGTYEIPEVCLLFDSRLFRGNRTIKSDNINLDAFESPNLDPLVKIGIDIKINWDIVKPKNAGIFNYFEVILKKI